MSENQAKLHLLQFTWTCVCYRCIRGLLKDKLVVLVTHQVHFALQGDKLLALKDVSLFEYSLMPHKRAMQHALLFHRVRSISMAVMLTWLRGRLTLCSYWGSYKIKTMTTMNLHTKMMILTMTVLWQHSKVKGLSAL